MRRRQRPPIITPLNEMSEKPEHHAAIAVYYRTVAAEARAEAQKHEAMRSTYRRGHQRFGTGRSGRQSMTRQCDRLIELHQEAASEDEALALLHDEEAAARQRPERTMLRPRKTAMGTEHSSS